MAQSTASITPIRAKGYAPLRFRAGEDVDIIVTINVAAGTDENLSGDDLHWSMRPVDGIRNVLNKSVGDGITVTGESTGAATVAVSSNNTKNLAPGYYFHQLWIEEADGDYEIIFAGIIKLQPQLILGQQSQVLELV